MNGVFKIFRRFSAHAAKEITKEPAKNKLKQKHVRVTILGSDTNVGEATALLLKQNPLISQLHVYGEDSVATAADLRHLDTRSIVVTHLKTTPQKKFQMQGNLPPRQDRPTERPACRRPHPPHGRRDRGQSHPRRGGIQTAGQENHRAGGGLLAARPQINAGGVRPARLDDLAAGGERLQEDALVSPGAVSGIGGVAAGELNECRGVVVDRCAVVASVCTREKL